MSTTPWRVQAVALLPKWGAAPGVQLPTPFTDRGAHMTCNVEIDLKVGGGKVVVDGTDISGAIHDVTIHHAAGNTLPKVTVTFIAGRITGSALGEYFTTMTDVERALLIADGWTPPDREPA